MSVRARKCRNGDFNSQKCPLEVGKEPFL